MARNIRDELLAEMLGVDEAHEYAVRMFCRPAEPVEFEGQMLARTMFCGSAIGDMLDPKANGDQLVLARLVVIPYQIYTGKRRTKSNPFGGSPAAGLRSDQIMAGGAMSIEAWPKRIR